MKSLLIGNGINIQFGGLAYTSKFILKRIKYKAKSGGYNKLFDGQLSKKDIVNVFEGFVDVSNDIIEGEYDSLIDNDDELEALSDYKTRYGAPYPAVCEPHEIMLEDWFFLIHLFFLKNTDIGESIESVKQGFERLILDAIYNDGNLQLLHTKMNKKVKKFIKEYSNVFTLNYDNNIENLTQKDVFHLHGDYSVLHQSENPDYAQGFLRINEGKSVIKDEFSHCYCNALLDYSGSLKLKRATNNIRAINETIKLEDDIKAERITKEEVLKALSSNLDSRKMVQARFLNPTLKIATDYHFDKLRNIEGELHIIGMSPNNDDHIFNLINTNEDITKVIFYYYSKDNEEYIHNTFDKNIYMCKDIRMLWSDLGVKHKRFHCNYNIEEKLERFYDSINAMSDDVITKEEIIKEVNSIPRYEMTRLTKLVKELRADVNGSNEKDLNGEKLLEDFSRISYIALREGISPSVLYVVVVMNWSQC